MVVVESFWNAGYVRQLQDLVLVDLLRGGIVSLRFRQRGYGFLQKIEPTLDVVCPRFRTSAAQHREHHDYLSHPMTVTLWEVFVPSRRGDLGPGSGGARTAPAWRSRRRRRLA